MLLADKEEMQISLCPTESGYSVPTRLSSLDNERQNLLKRTTTIFTNELNFYLNSFFIFLLTVKNLLKSEVKPRGVFFCTILRNIIRIFSAKKKNVVNLVIYHLYWNVHTKNKDFASSWAQSEFK